MTNALWAAEVSRVGVDAGEMLEAGVLILFGEPVPDALADVSVVHVGANPPSRPLEPGDQFHFAGNTYSVDEVGGRANDNLTELGHVVLYVDQPDQELLPGAVKVSGPPLGAPEVGSAVKFVAG